MLATPVHTTKSRLFTLFKEFQTARSARWSRILDTGVAASYPHHTASVARKSFYGPEIPAVDHGCRNIACSQRRDQYWPLLRRSPHFRFYGFAVIFSAFKTLPHRVHSPPHTTCAVPQPRHGSCTESPSSRSTTPTAKDPFQHDDQHAPRDARVLHRT